MPSNLIPTGATKSELAGLLDEHHYLGARCADPVACYAWRAPGGLLGDTGEPQAGIVYASPINRFFGPGALELTRLVRAESLNAYLSQFVAWSFRHLKRTRRCKYVLSYADSGADHHGGIYQASNMIYVGESPGHGFWCNPQTGERCSSRAFDQRRPEYRAGWQKKQSAAKYLYVQPITATWKELESEFGWKRLSYPKPALDSDRETFVI